MEQSKQGIAIPGRGRGGHFNHRRRTRSENQGSEDECHGSYGTPTQHLHEGLSSSPRSPAGRGGGFRGRGRGNRSRPNSESERGGKTFHRKRGISETENVNMTGLQCLAMENIWYDKHRYDEAERCFYEGPNAQVKTSLQSAKSPKPKRPHRNSHSKSEHHDTKGHKADYHNMHTEMEEMRALIRALEERVTLLEKAQPKAATCAKPAAPKAAAAPPKKVVVQKAPAPADEDEDDDSDMDLFGSDAEDEEAAKVRQARVDEYAAKKSKKPALIAKSSILLDVKPWDDETDMAKLEECVRSVQADGLLWGASKLVPVGYGIKKLQISVVVEDDKVGTDMLEEEITKFEDYVQSVDVAAFNKI